MMDPAPPSQFGEPPSQFGSGLPDLEPLAFPDEPKMRLPTFDEYKRGPSKPPPPKSGAYQSKLPAINQGRPAFEVDKEEKPLFERVVFGLAWGGVFFLVAVELFVSSPLFAQVKPTILRFLGDGS